YLIRGIAIGPAVTDQLAHGKSEQDQSARNLKIGHGNSKSGENSFTEKDKADCHQQSGQQSKKCLMSAMFMGRVCAESQENRDQPDGIDGNEHRNEREQEFLKG